MIQLNLLPDIKLEFIKAKRLKRVVIVISVIVMSASATLFVIMLSLTSLQKKHISDLDTNIGKISKELRETPDLAKILTIQNQLNSLPALYDKRPVVSRLFPYIEQITPPLPNGITDMIVDFEGSTMSIEGKSDTLDTVNHYIDTLKFTDYNYTAKDEKGEIKAYPSSRAFSDVLMKEFKRDTKDGAKFTITLKFSPDIFDSHKTVTLVVPTAVTTRSETELPGSGIFEKKTTD